MQAERERRPGCSLDKGSNGVLFSPPFFDTSSEFQMRIRMLAFVAGTALLVACGKGNGGSGSTGGSNGTSGACNAATTACPCTDDSKCDTAHGYSCDTEQTKTCIFQCRQASDCVADYAPDSVRTACKASVLGCTCPYDASSGLSQCETKGCGTDGDCPSGGQVCQNGQCVTDPASTVGFCQVFPEYQVFNAGQTVTYRVQGYTSDPASGGTPVHVLDADVTWSPNNAPLTNSGATFTASNSGSGVDTNGPTATFHGVSCRGTSRVYPAATDFRVVVIDAYSGTPLQGATVVVDGATLGGGTTDASGISHGNVGSGAHTVSVFEVDHDYVTVYQTTSSDLLIPVTRNTEKNEGGASGTVNNLFQANSKIHAGFFGMSIPGSITDLSTSLLIGPLQPLSGTVGGKSFNLNVPGGVVLGLNDQKFKDHYTVVGASGWCSDAVKTKAGTCGTRSVWGLAGDISIDKISPLIDQISGGTGVANINIGSVLKSLLPVFRTFNSLIVRDESFDLGPTTTDAVNGTKPIVAAAYLKALDLDAAASSAQGQAVKLGLKLTVKVPALPQVGGKTVDGALVLAAADVPGRGLVPLGLSAGIDNTGTTANPVTTGHVKDEAGVPDQLILNMAPAHNGAESGPYRMAVLASSFSNLGSGIVASGLVYTPGACTSGTGGICYGATIGSTSTPFLSFPEGLLYDYGSRTLAVGSAGAPSGANIMRLDFTGTDHRWFIYFSSTTAVLQLPTPPAPFEDRSFENGGRKGYFVLAFDVGSAQLDDAAKFGSPAANLQKLDRFITRFAIKDYPAPSIKITAPSAGATVAAGSTVTVKIAGADQFGNKWRLCFNTGAAITNSDLSACTAGGAVDSTGKATASLPASAASGQSGKAHAVLVDSNGALLQPGSVEDSVTLTIQ
jgi:hypothetical protein